MKLESPLYLFSTPLEWLRAGGMGSCVINWEAGAATQLGIVNEIRCDKPEWADRLYTAMKDRANPPEILVPVGGSDATAA